MRVKNILAFAMCTLFALCCFACSPPISDSSFMEDAAAFEAHYKGDAHGIPFDGYRHVAGKAFSLSGRIEANKALSSVTLKVYSVFNGNFKPVNAELAFEESTLSADVSAFNELVDFSVLTPGVHMFSISATGQDGETLKSIASARFYVMEESWEQLEPSHFYDSYPETLAFFGGDTDAFLFPFQRVNGRYIMAHPNWEEKYITTLSAYPNGFPWTVHTFALPNFEKALSYLENVHIRVQGREFDSGVIPLYSLIQSYNGCFVSRFTSSEKYISHHSFGTAVDINAAMEPNLNTAENQQLIRSEVGSYLSYNGILEQNGIPYYSFTYSGNYPKSYNGIPETVINYLLYELAFYRSGFIWAHYYASTSDGMHFALTEYVTHDHQGEFGLRKVFDYISQEQ